LVRSEQEIFHELTQLCCSPGFVHAIAYLAFRHNVVAYSRTLTAKHVQSMYSGEQIIRTELTTLLGLIIKEPIDFSIPSQESTEHYVLCAESLLAELHKAISAPAWAAITAGPMPGSDYNPLAKGETLREPIFYSGETAYYFQYRDFASRKYAKDNNWIRDNKGFSIETARRVVHSVGDFQNARFPHTISALKNLPREQWTILPAFGFTSNDIALHSGVAPAEVQRILYEFSIHEDERNSTFRALNDFNAASAWPLIRKDDSYFLFNHYSFAEALYDAPFYWMSSDKRYFPTAMQHRGEFTEEFTKDRLAACLVQGTFT
jgi:hypothetical protein